MVHILIVMVFYSCLRNGAYCNVHDVCTAPQGLKVPSSCLLSCICCVSCACVLFPGMLLSVFVYAFCFTESFYGWQLSSRSRCLEPDPTKACRKRCTDFHSALFSDDFVSAATPFLKRGVSPSSDVAPLLTPTGGKWQCAPVANAASTC